MSALNIALCRRGIILWLAAVLLLASRSTHSAPVYDQDTTQIAEYDAAIAGCYFNFQRYQEGDRIMTSEPCLNCTCHNRMLMCYLKVCPFTKAIGQDCTVEKRPDQCCPVITCPEVPVQLLTSTTSAPAGSDSTEVGFHDNYGCHVDERFYADGAMLPVDHHNPCELCYCIRNRTTCVMQECTLRVAGCKPVYQPGVCCPIKYDCEYDEESSTTVGPTPGLIMTTTLPPGMLPQCYYENKVYEDGDLINSSQPCQHCYCFRGEIACAVQNCGTPMQAHGKNCTALPPPEGECCPTTYQCEEELPEEGEEQLSEQTPYKEQIMTESPMIIDQEDQQMKDEHPQEETFPGIDNAIPFIPEEEEEKGVQGIIEHVTEIPTTEKPEEQSATPPIEENAVPETETTTVAKESTLSSSIPSHTEATKMEASTSERTEESLSTEAPIITELPVASSTSEDLQEKAITTEHISEEHISTKESIPEKEHSTPATAEKESTEPSIGEEAQTKATAEPEISSHKEVSEELITTEKAEISEKPETSTEIIERGTSPSPIEESGIIPESVTEQTKEDKGETETETLATELPVEKETATVSHKMSTTEQIETEVPHRTEINITEEPQSTEASSSPKEQSFEEEQISVTKKEQTSEPEESTSEHEIIKEEPATVSAKKEDSGLTESPDISKESVTEEKHVKEESTSEMPAQGPIGIPIPERSPGQKAEDENVYHVTDDYHDVTRPEVTRPDNLLTESPQKIPTTYLPQEQEISLIPSEKTQKPIKEEGTEIPKEVTEINLPTQPKPEITEITEEETKTEITSAITKAESSTETSVTTIAPAEHEPEEKIPEEIEMPSVSEKTDTEMPEREIQSTEETPSGEEMPTKGLGIDISGESSSSEEVSGEQGEKKVQPKKEQPSEEETETHVPTTELEASVSIPEQEYSTVLPSLGEQLTEGEQATTVISPAEQSTPVPKVEEQTEIAAEKGKPVISEKPVEENVIEQSTKSPGTTVSGEEEKELQTTESISKEEEITVIEEKSTTQAFAGEEQKTEQPEQYSTEKSPEESTITESHVQKTETPKIEEKPLEVESTEGISTESVNQTEATIIRKEPSETEIKPTEMTEIKPTEMTVIKQTELPVIVEYSTKIDEAEKEGKEKIQTERPEVETASTEAPILEQTEKIQTESSVTEGLPNQPSIPLDRKEDQESVEPIPSKKEQEDHEQITQKPSPDEKEVSEIYEEPQKSTVSSEVEVTHIPPSEEVVTKSTLPEEKSTEVVITTESIGTGEAATQPVELQPEITSVQPEEAATKLPEQKEQTQGPVIKEPEEVLMIETTSVTSTSKISEEPVTSEKEAGISKSTEAPASEGITTELISEVSTESSRPVEEHTEPEIFVERQPETYEEVTQSSTTKEKPSEEGETEGILPEVFTEKVTVSEIPKVSIPEKQPQEEKEIAKGSTEIPEHGVQSTLAPEETSEMKITEVSQHSTELPTSIPEKEGIPEITPRPSGIPGEGNCLVEGQSYNNNSAIPPANLCQTSCRCVSSIVQCELVQCPAPPAHLSNCMPVHSTESCCPMYACEETIPELESDSHKIESHIPETEREKITSTTELLTEAPVTEITSKESSTIIGEIITPESQPAQVTVPSVSPSEEEIKSTATEKQLITESVEQPTTIGQPIEQHPEEHTISPVSETSKEPTIQVPEEKEHIIPEETTEAAAGEAVTKSAISTEQPTEKQTIVSGEEQSIITSTSIPPEQEPGAEEEGPTDHHKEEVTIPTKQETPTSAEIETSTSAEIPTIPSKEEESTTLSKEQEKLGEKDVKEQSTFKPVKEGEMEQPGEEKMQSIPTSEEPITIQEHEISIKPKEEIVTEKLSTTPEVSEQTTIKPDEYESTSVSEVQPITEQKPEIEQITEKETGYKEQEIITSTESGEAVVTEKPESETKLSTAIASDKVEKPIESTTSVQTEEAPSEDLTTVKSEEVSTEESKSETKPAISTEIPEIEEHAATPSLPSETPSEEPVKPTEESISEISHKETLPETVEPPEGEETTEHPEEHTELSVTEGKPSVTKLPAEKPIEVESPVTTEQSATEILEAEYEKPTEPIIIHEPESTQVPIEVHPEIIPETESHTPESPEEHTILEEVLTTSVHEGEQPTKETVPNLGGEQTEQSIIPEAESEIPVVKEEHVTTSTEEQTPKSVEQVPIEEQTVTSFTSSEGEATEQITPESVTTQEEQKTTDSAKPETELPGSTEEQTVSPESHKEEEQKSETGMKEEPVTIAEVTEMSKEKTTEEAVTPVGITESHPSVEEHTLQEEITPSKVETSQQPIETTTAQEEQRPEEEVQVTSEISLSQHPLSEETTTVASQIFEEHPAVSTEAVELGGPHEYETTSIAEEEVSKPVTEVSEVEKLSPEKESATTEGFKLEEAVTKISEISSTEKPVEALPETEKPVPQEQETELPKKDDTTSKPVESIIPEEKLPEEIETEVKSTKAPVGEKEEEEEAHSTTPTPIETTSVQTEEQPLITKLQPTEYPPSLPPQEIQPEESEKAHTTTESITEEGHPSLSEESQYTTEYASEISVTIKIEKLPETEQTEPLSETESPIKVSNVPTESPEEKTTIRPSSEEPETQAPLRPEESPIETPEEPLIKTQSTESPTVETEITEEEVPSQESEEIGHPHVEEDTVKSETDEEHLQPVNHTAEMTEQPYQPSFHEQHPTTILTPHIPEFPDQNVPGDNPHFPEDGGSYLHPDEDYDEDDQIYGPGTCRYGGKVYVSAQQIPRDDPCDFCFCFRSDIICLQQSCPPPIPGCHEEPISGFCCPRYECPVSMATALNLTTTTTTTTTTLPPHFNAHAYKGAAKRSGCQIDGHVYQVGEVITSQSGPCTNCICGGDGKMKCDPLVCSPEPILRQMIAAATAKRRR